MILRSFAFIVLIVFSLGASAQNVTFSGSVNRHELSDRSIEIQGTVQILSGGLNTDELVAFTIPSGQTSASYSKTVPWA